MTEETKKRKIKLLSPNIILVFSFLSILLCWMYGFIGLGLGILAFRSLRMIKKMDIELKETTAKKLQWSWQMGLVGTVLSGLFTIYYLLVIVFRAWISWI